MTRYALLIDLRSCVGCGTCDIVCKIENHAPSGVFLSYHVCETLGTFPDVRMDYRPIMCNHCQEPACAKACPTGALHKDDVGLTVVDRDVCEACGSCVKACPYGAIHIAAAGVDGAYALKCQMCKHRVHDGQVPRCVEACPTGARVFGDEEDERSTICQLKQASNVSVRNPDAGTEPRVYYVGSFSKGFR